jgi:putative membrane protein
VPWLKLLHMGFVIVWCGALLYLPALIAAAAAPAPPSSRDVHPQWSSLPRRVFVGLATPAALLAIVSGTLIFVSQGLLAPWLMFKLAGVGLLVLGHGACGVLVLRTERGQRGGVRFACHIVLISTVLCLLGIAWLVLRKPT